MDQQNNKPKMIDSHVLHKNRPLSPHLSIYRPQLTSILSILHRITGSYLYLGIVILAWFLFTLTYFPNVINNFALCVNTCNLTSFALQFLLLSWCFSLFYHLLNGIRHLFWDIGKGFELKNTYITGKLVVIFSILFTFISWFLACNDIPADNQEQTVSDTVIIENDRE